MIVALYCHRARLYSQFFSLACCGFYWPPAYATLASAANGLCERGQTVLLDQLIFRDRLSLTVRCISECTRRNR